MASWYKLNSGGATQGALEEEESLEMQTGIGRVSMQGL